MEKGPKSWVNRQKRTEGHKYERHYFDKHKSHDIYQFCSELAKYLKNEDIKNILFLDRSARPAWIGVDEYWNKNYPDQPKPGFYFTNPDGMESDEQGLILNGKDALAAFNHLLLTGSLPKEKGRTFEDVVARFKEAYPKLVEDLDEPLVVFDTCSHTGETIHTVIDVLAEIGFTDIRPITANTPDWDSEVETVATIDNEVRLTSCYPFGKHSLVKKTDDVISSPNPENLELGTKIRQEIRSIMRGV